MHGTLRPGELKLYSLPVGLPHAMFQCRHKNILLHRIMYCVVGQVTPVCASVTTISILACSKPTIGDLERRGKGGGARSCEKFTD